MIVSGQDLLHCSLYIRAQCTLVLGVAVQGKQDVLKEKSEDVRDKPQEAGNYNVVVF